MNLGRKAINLVSVLVCLNLLTGCFAAAVGGVGAVGYSGAQERSFGNAVDDNVIAASIKSRYIQSKFNDLFINLGIDVHEGRVLITGTVQDPEDSVEAVRLAWKSEGVKEVINEIQIRNKSSIKDLAKDSWISTQISSKLLFNKKIHYINYSVETVNGVVYVMGLAQTQSELDLVTEIASKVKGVKKVISHVRFVDDVRRQ